MYDEALTTERSEVYAQRLSNNVNLEE